MDHRARATHDLQRLLYLLGQDDVYSRYMARLLGRFLRAYGRGDGEDAAILVRKAAECYALAVVYCAEGVLADDLLGALLWRMPYASTVGTAYRHCAHPIVTRVAAELCLGLSVRSIWADLQDMRNFGNAGAHAHSIFRGEDSSMEALFLPMLRVCLSMCGLGFRNKAYRSRL